MPSGVCYDFLNLLEDGQRQSLVRLAPLALAGLAGGFVAEMLDPGRIGTFVGLYLSMLAVGLIVGGLLGWREINTWGDSLREQWNDWMQSSQGASTVGEAAQRTGAPRIRVPKPAAAALVALNVACLVAAWFTLPSFTLTTPYGLFTVATVAATGVTIGIQAPVWVAEAWWCREIEDQTLSLVEEGHVGVWGVR